MNIIRKFVLAAMLAVTAVAAMPIVSTGAFAQCPDKCPSK